MDVMKATVELFLFRAKRQKKSTPETNLSMTKHESDYVILWLEAAVYILDILNIYAV